MGRKIIKFKEIGEAFIVTVGDSLVYADKNDELYLGGSDLEIPVFNSIQSAAVFEKRARYKFGHANLKKVMFYE